MKEGDALFAVSPPAGLPLVFRTRVGAVQHLECLEDFVRARCSLLTLRVERVEAGARDARDEAPTLRDASVAPLTDRPLAVEDFAALVHTEETDPNG